MLVVVLEVDPQDLLQMPSSYDQQPVQALGPDPANPVGASYSVASCDLRVLMNQPTKSISSQDAWSQHADRSFAWSKRRRLPERAMRTVPVVVRNVLSQHRAQMPAADDQHWVQHLPPNRADPPLGEGVRPRWLHRRDAAP
jgi:hypothetical protein